MSDVPAKANKLVADEAACAALLEDELNELVPETVAATELRRISE